MHALCTLPNITSSSFFVSLKVLMRAAWGGNLEVVQLLVNTGRANLDAVNQNGYGMRA